MVKFSLTAIHCHNNVTIMPEDSGKLLEYLVNRGKYIFKKLVRASFIGNIAANITGFTYG
jgi:hypothetical protein